jgi:nucleoid DNA-binding protein
LTDNISKNDLWYYVNNKLKHSIHSKHVLAVLNILFDEMLSDLQQGKTVNVINLGALSLPITKPRKHYHIHLRKVVQSTGHRIIKFLLAPTIRKKIIQFLDIDRTFRHD